MLLKTFKENHLNCIELEALYEIIQWIIWDMCIYIYISIALQFWDGELE